ncbi:MAG: tRNA (adenosine(37)-N6)-dimethylallyltransferase MiaA [Deltaproteobacteria bacterium]|nr:tRNA (adenosine(37)-N6)-dimethylallyltransferase MiaA [Deltaproteobacteria bacterium]
MTGESPAKPKAKSLPLIAVVGPTASGKTALAVEIALRFGGEVINTDSMQVYRHLDIGTGKPSPSQRQGVVHHLLDTVNPDESYSAGQYVKQAGVVIDSLQAQGRPAILCGGTGLYFRALVEGLASIPPIPPAVRREAGEMIRRLGPVEAHAALARLDPVTAARLNPNDTQRVGRGLEVVLATGRGLTDFHNLGLVGQRPEPVVWVGIRWPREDLYRRINRRVEIMLEAGWVEEVRQVAARYSFKAKPLQAIGYREVGRYLTGSLPKDQLAPAITQRTRQYAKRQITWFGRNPKIYWAPPDRTGDIPEFLAPHLMV